MKFVKNKKTWKTKKLVSKSNFVFFSSTFLLSACTPTARPLDIIYKNVYGSDSSNLNSIKKEFFTNHQGFEASDPRVTCEGKDPSVEKQNYCHYKYINQRTMSLKFDSTTWSEAVSGSWGTGWIVDRIKNTNDFLVATNIHVINQLSKKSTTEVSDLDANKPQAVQKLLYGVQPLISDLNNAVDPLLSPSYKQATNWNPTNYWKPENRLLLVDAKTSTPEGSEKIDYSISLGNNIVYRNQGWISNNLLNSTSLDKTSSMESSWEENFKKEFVPSHIASIMSKIFWSQQFFSPSKSKSNPYAFDKGKVSNYFSQAEQDRLAKETKDLEKYVDAAVIKITIPDEDLSNMFPYFLNPKKYNDWTFPRFNQSEITKVSDEGFSKQYFDNFFQSDFSLNESDATNFWHAGYPVEQHNNSLQFKSKSGPIFKGSSGQLKFFSPSVKSERSLDHFTCKQEDYFKNCQDKPVPMGAYSWRTKADYYTGGGSSGSMVINKNYETTGIYWGGSAVTGNPLYKEEFGLIFPLYTQKEVNQVKKLKVIGYGQLDDKKDPKDSNKLTKRQKFFFEDLKPWFTETFIEEAPVVIANTYVSKFLEAFESDNSTNKTSVKTKFPFDFENNDKLNTSVKNFLEKKVNMNKTYLANDQISKMRTMLISSLKKVIKQLIQEQLKDQNSGLNSNIVAAVTLFYNLFNDRNVLPYFGNQIGVGAYQSYLSGKINLKQQLFNYLKNKNIATYSLNNSTVLPTWTQA